MFNQKPVHWTFTLYFFAIQTFGLNSGDISNYLLNNLFYSILLKLYFTNIILSQLLKKPEKGGEAATEKTKEQGEEIDAGDGQREACPSCTVVKAKPWESTQDRRREK